MDNSSVSPHASQLKSALPRDKGGSLQILEQLKKELEEKGGRLRRESAGPFNELGGWDPTADHFQEI